MKKLVSVMMHIKVEALLLGMLSFHNQSDNAFQISQSTFTRP